MPGTPTLGVRLDPETQARLNALAAATGRTKAFYVREAVLRHLDDLEDTYLADQRSEDVKAGRDETIPLGDLIARYGVDD